MGLLSFLLIVILGALVLFFVRTYQMEAKGEQQEFLNGKAPPSLPHGFLKGSVPGRTVPPGGWKGKKIDAATGTGKNVFEKSGVQMEKYAFRTYIGRGIRDAKDVLKIDYDIPGNAFWLRRVLDEVVETAPGKFLGKAHLRILPGIPFTVIFFRMEQ